MGLTRFIYNSLNAGELTPRLSARDDYERYANGVREMTNFIPLVQGGVRVRPGLQWVARTRDNQPAYLIPFEFSTVQAYIIEAGANYFRFYKDRGRIFDLSGTITNVTNNGSGAIRITATAHGLSSGNRVEIVGVKGTVEANGEWVVTVVDANTYDLNGSTYANAYTGGGTWNRPYELTTPYSLADLADVRWAQSADTLFLAHRLHPLRQLTRTGHTAWTLSTVNLVDGPYMPINTNTSLTMNCSATAPGTTGTLTASSAYFTPNHVGAFFRLFVNGTWGYVRVDSYSSPTVVNITVMTTIGGTTSTSTWREGSFSTHRGFPAVVGFIEQRLVLASTNSEPQHVWLSATGAYNDFTPTAPTGTVNSDHALTYKLGADIGKVNVIRWLIGGRNLQIGTTGEEFVLDGGNLALTPTSPPIARAYTTYGSANIAAVRAGRHTLYVQRGGRRLRAMSFDFSSDSYVAPDVSVFAEHFFRTATITRMAFQGSPDPVLWCVLSDGTLATLSYDESQRLIGWARQVTNGSVLDVAVIPSPDLRVDDVWCVVRRTVNGTPRYFVEFTAFDQNSDSSLTYDGTIHIATLTPSHTSGAGRTFTASSPVFVSTDVGNELILLGYTVNGTKWYSRARIVSVVNSTTVLADITSDFPNTNPIPAGLWGIGKTKVFGLHHLAGETVTITGDNAVYDPKVVAADGSVELSYGTTTGPAAVVIKVGLPRTPHPTIRTLQPVYRDQAGTVRGKFKHWSEVFLALEETSGLTVNANQLQYRRPSDPMDVGPPLFSGEKRVANLGWSRDGTLTIVQELPLPATVLAIYGDLDVGD